VSTQEERQLSDLLHRVTPEPPRGVTVEDVAIRVAGEAVRSRRAYRQPRIRRGWAGRGRAWVPALAAAAVVAVAAASAGVATLLTSRGGPASPASGHGSTAPPAPASASASSPAARQRPAARPAFPPRPVAGAPWGAELINPDEVAQDSLTAGDGSLYAVVSGSLDRIDPATGNVLRSAPYQSAPPLVGPPVVAGNTVWAVWSYSGRSVLLHGYDGTTLAPLASVTVPVTGWLPATAQGVLTAGPDGNLYLAAGGAVAVVSPSRHRVIRQIRVPAPVISVAVAPDGSRMYVSTSATGQPFGLLVYDLATGTVVASSTGSAAGGGNLVATAGGVWGTAGSGMSQWTWFAPGGNLARSVRVQGGAGGGLASVPTASGGAVWIGGSRTLACASPATGAILASAAIAAEGGAPQYLGRVAVIGGHAYADYQGDQAGRLGVVRMTPPAACFG
jgi:hypothetical protein